MISKLYCFDPSDTFGQDPPPLLFMFLFSPRFFINYNHIALPIWWVLRVYRTQHIEST